jgi:hypothetical protein
MYELHREGQWNQRQGVVLHLSLRKEGKRRDEKEVTVEGRVELEWRREGFN